MEQVTVVPCNGCTECCKFGDCMDLKPIEIPVDAEGNCIYLDSEGCTIWPNCPTVEFRDFDCLKLLTHEYKAVVPERILKAAIRRAYR